MGEIIDMAEFRERKAARTLAQKQFHPAGTNKKKPNKKGVVGKGLNPEDYQD